MIALINKLPLKQSSNPFYAAILFILVSPVRMTSDRPPFWKKLECGFLPHRCAIMRTIAATPPSFYIHRIHCFSSTPYIVRNKLSLLSDTRIEFVWQYSQSERKTLNTGQLFDVVLRCRTLYLLTNFDLQNKEYLWVTRLVKSHPKDVLSKFMTFW